MSPLSSQSSQYEPTHLPVLPSVPVTLGHSVLFLIVLDQHKLLLAGVPVSLLFLSIQELRLRTPAAQVGEELL